MCLENWVNILIFHPFQNKIARALPLQGSRSSKAQTDLPHRGDFETQAEDQRHQRLVSEYGYHLQDYPLLEPLCLGLPSARRIDWEAEAGNSWGLKCFPKFENMHHVLCRGKYGISNRQQKHHPRNLSFTAVPARSHSCRCPTALSAKMGTCFWEPGPLL